MRTQNRLKTMGGTQMIQPIRTFALLALLLAYTLPASAKLTEYTLENGMRVLVKEDHRAPVVVQQVWYRVGATYEPAGKTGVSHMLEHMMFKGTKTLKPGEFSKIISQLGGQENAFTSSDYTAYYQVVGKQHLEKVMQLESERMRHLVIDEQEFLKEREVVTEERRWRLEDQPGSKLREQFHAAAFLNSPARNPVIGWMTDIRHYRVEDLTEWYRKWYAPNNAALVVVGDVNPQEVLALAQKYYGGYKAEALPEIKPQIEIEQEGLRRIELKGNVQVPRLQMGFHVPSLLTAQDPQEVYALAVLSSLLDGGESSRLPQKLVREQKIASGVSSRYSATDRLATLFEISATPANGGDVKELEAAILSELDVLKRTLVSQEELQRVWAMDEADHVYYRDSIQAQASVLGSLVSVGLPADTLDHWIDRIRQVTPQQVQAVAKKYLHADNLTIATLYPDGKDHSNIKPYTGRL